MLLAFLQLWDAAWHGTRYFLNGEAFGNQPHAPACSCQCWQRSDRRKIRPEFSQNYWNHCPHVPSISDQFSRFGKLHLMRIIRMQSRICLGSWLIFSVHRKVLSDIETILAQPHTLNILDHFGVLSNRSEVGSSSAANHQLVVGTDYPNW